MSFMKVRAGCNPPAACEDDVLAVRHERELVCQQAVHERAQVTAWSRRTDPLGRFECRCPTNAAATTGRARRIPVQEGGERHHPLAGTEPWRGALSPERGEHLAVRGGESGVRWNTSPVYPIAACSRSTSNRASRRVGVGGDETEDPVVDRGGPASMHAVRGRGGSRGSARRRRA